MPEKMTPTGANSSIYLEKDVGVLTPPPYTGETVAENWNVIFEPLFKGELFSLTYLQHVIEWAERTPSDQVNKVFDFTLKDNRRIGEWREGEPSVMDDVDGLAQLCDLTESRQHSEIRLLRSFNLILHALLKRKKTECAVFDAQTKIPQAGGITLCAQMAPVPPDRMRSIFGQARLAHGDYVLGTDGKEYKTFEFRRNESLPMVKFLYLLSCLHEDAIRKFFDNYSDQMSHEYETYGKDDQPELAHIRPQAEAMLMMYEVMDRLGLADQEPFSRLRRFIEYSTEIDHVYQSSRYTSAEKLKKVHNLYLAHEDPISIEKPRLKTPSSKAMSGYEKLFNMRARLKNELEEVAATAGNLTRTTIGALPSVVASGALSGTNRESASIRGKNAFGEGAQRVREARERLVGLRRELAQVEKTLLDAFNLKFIRWGPPEDQEKDERKLAEYSWDPVLVQRFEDFCHTILDIYKSDPTLSAKARADNRSAYFIDRKRLCKDPFMGRLFVSFVEGDCLRMVSDEDDYLQIVDPAEDLVFKYITYKIYEARNIPGERDFLFSRSLANRASPRWVNPWKGGSLGHERWKIEGRYRFRHNATPLFDRDISVITKPTIKEVSELVVDGSKRWFSKTSEWVRHGNGLRDIGGVIAVATSILTFIEFVGSTQGVDVLGSIYHTLFPSEKIELRDRSWIKFLIPEGAKRPEVESKTPTYYGKAVSLPQEFLTDGVSLGMRIETPIMSGEIEPGMFVSDADQFYARKDDTIIYSAPLEEQINPPFGWKITEILDTDGRLSQASPRRTILEGVQFDLTKHLPETVFIKAEKTQYASDETGRVNDIHFQAYPYQIPDSDKDVASLRKYLKDGSPITILFDELSEDVAEWRSRSGTPQEYSALMTDALQRLAGHITQDRYYALIDIPPNMTVLQYLTEHPESGFYCQEAAELVEDFFSPFGIHVTLIGGRGTMVYGNGTKLFNSKVGHAQAILVLPDGDIKHVDLTPPVTNETPQSDIDALAETPPSAFQLAVLDIDAKDIALRYGIPLADTGALLYILARWRRRAGNRDLDETSPRGYSPNSAGESNSAELVTISEQLKKIAHPENREAMSNLLVALSELPIHKFEDTLKAIHRTTPFGGEASLVFDYILNRTDITWGEWSESTPTVSDLLHEGQTKYGEIPDDVRKALETISPEQFTVLTRIAWLSNKGEIAILRKRYAMLFREDDKALVSAKFDEYLSAIGKIVDTLIPNSPEATEANTEGQNPPA